MKKKVTLVFPRFKYPSGDFSLGLAYIGAYLRENVEGIDISQIDTSYHPSMQYVREKLDKHSPDIVLIYTDTLMFQDAAKVAQECRKKGIHVLMGGPHPTIMPKKTVTLKAVDAICIGEGEITSKEYIDEFYGEKKFEKVKGVWYKKGGRLFRNSPRPVIQDLDKLPFPAVDLFEIETYIQNFVQLDSYDSSIRGMSLIASRGCPYQCSYCQPTLKHIFGPKLRIRSPENIIEEMKQLIQKYRIQAFYFQDDTLTVFKEWMRKFCSLLMKENLGIVWACNTRADTYDADMLKMMKKAGCVKIKVGVESITDRIRNGIYRKNVSRKQIEGLIRDCNKLGIQVAGFFMLGAPTETEKEVWNTISFAVRSDLTEANFSITTPLPETGLYNYVKDKGWTVPHDFSCFDYYQVKRPKMAKEEISIKKLRFYKKIANFYFYLHPKRFWNTFRQSLNLKKLFLKLKRL
ncbi:radical SAM protein [Candidatus Woesearchaeota archaeon]|nr:radical SAM protein [Candidatus Woesearchaeota archaeon]